jgi:Fe-S cluster biogenesis protein NfuA
MTQTFVPEAQTSATETVPKGPVATVDSKSAAQNTLQEGWKLQQLIQQVGELRDPVGRALIHECLHSLLDYYGNGLAQVLQIARGCGPAGELVLERLVDDPLVRGLLLIHGLHPVDLPTRLNLAIEKVRPYMHSHGGNVELLSLQNDFATFRLQGSCKTCPSSSITMELALRRVLEEDCPDLAGFAVEGVQPAAS